MRPAPCHGSGPPVSCALDEGTGNVRWDHRHCVISASTPPRRELRSTGLRLSLLGSTLLLSAAGRNSPWREALNILQRREAEGMSLDEVALRKMCL